MMSTASGKVTRTKLIGKPWLILLTASVITMLLGLPRLQMMLRLENAEMISFDTRDYIHRLIVTFVSSLLILSFNLYIEKFKWGPINISFSQVCHLIGTNLILFASIQLFIFFRLVSRVQVETGQTLGGFFLWTIAVNASVAIVCILLAIFYRNVKEKYLVKLENVALQKETAQAKFAQLREQINPHFMFNSFSTLNGLIDESPERAKKFLINMSDVYRYVLKSETATTVSLDQELHFARVYAAMIAERFPGKISFEFDVPADQLSLRVVPLSIQMLIENAVKHNHFHHSNPLKIKIKVVGNHLEVYNNLRKRANLENNHSLGLYNLNQRYKYASKEEVIIVQTHDHFSVKLPLMK